MRRGRTGRADDNPMRARLHLGVGRARRQSELEADRVVRFQLLGREMVVVQSGWMADLLTLNW